MSPLRPLSGALFLAARPPEPVLLARFGTPRAAPLAGALPVDVGVLTVVDANGVMSIANGVLAVSGTPTAADGLVTPVALPIPPGRALLWDIPTRTSIGAGNSPRFGLSTVSLPSTDLGFGVDYSSTTAVRIKRANAVADTVTIGSGRHCFAFIRREVGGLLLARAGSTGPYTLLYPYPGTLTSAFVKMQLPANAVNFTVDDVGLWDLPYPWGTSYGLATTRLATTAAGDVLVAAADAVIEHTITAATGVIQELSVRRTTDNDRWIVRMAQATSTVKLIEVVGGVETERGSVSQTWTNGTTYRILVTLEGAAIRVCVAELPSLSYASAVSNQAATGVKVSHGGSNLVAWPRTLSLPWYLLGAAA